MGNPRCMLTANLRFAILCAVLLSYRYGLHWPSVFLQRLPKGREDAKGRNAVALFGGPNSMGK